MTTKIQSQALIPTKFGNFDMIAFSDLSDEKMPHIAMVHENTDFSRPVNVRIHSECITGDLFGSFRCDCGEQLEAAQHICQDEGGIILYLRQEGRGIGIINKLKAYQLQDTGLDTAEANLHLGFEMDERDFSIALEMLACLEVSRIRLLTNNPEKVKIFNQSSTVEVVERVPLIIPTKKENESYFKTKKEKFGHYF